VQIRHKADNPLFSNKLYRWSWRIDGNYRDILEGIHLVFISLPLTCMATRESLPKVLPSQRRLANSNKYKAVFSNSEEKHGRYVHEDHDSSF
jgi:hypothetical protein